MKVNVGLFEAVEVTLGKVANRGLLGEQATVNVILNGAVIGTVTRTARLGYARRGYTTCYAIVEANGEEFGQYETRAAAIEAVCREARRAAR